MKHSHSCPGQSKRGRNTHAKIHSAALAVSSTYSLWARARGRAVRTLERRALVDTLPSWCSDPHCSRAGPRRPQRGASCRSPPRTRAVPSGTKPRPSVPECEAIPSSSHAELPPPPARPAAPAAPAAPARPRPTKQTQTSDASEARTLPPLHPCRGRLARTHRAPPRAFPLPLAS